MKIIIWFEIEGNVEGRHKKVVDLSELGRTKDEWDALDEGSKLDAINEWSYGRIDIGWEPAD
jgi:hypothetical protein